MAAPNAEARIHSHSRKVTTYGSEEEYPRLSPVNSAEHRTSRDEPGVPASAQVQSIGR
jgi:hypothetical protein